MIKLTLKQLANMYYALSNTNEYGYESNDDGEYLLYGRHKTIRKIMTRIEAIFEELGVFIWDYNETDNGNEFIELEIIETEFKTISYAIKHDMSLCCSNIDSIFDKSEEDSLYYIELKKLLTEVIYNLKREVEYKLGGDDCEYN